MNSRRDFLRHTFGAACTVALARAAATPAPAASPVLDPSDPIAKLIRFRPGHYLDFPERLAADPTGAGAWLYAAAAHPGVRGISARVTWRRLEPRKGDYAFDTIDQILARAENVGKPLLLFLGDKSFSRDGLDVPDYIATDYDGVVRLDPNSRAKPVLRGGGGSMPRRWDPRVKERFELLLRALGRYDAHPLLEALLFQETHSKDFLVGPDYTTEKHLAAIRDRLRVAREALPHAQVCQYSNANFDDTTKAPVRFIGEYLREIRGMLGAPDILPFQPTQARDLHPFYKKYRGIIPLCAAMQNDSFRHRQPHLDAKGRSVPMDEMLDFALHGLHLNHIVWNAIPRGAEGFDYNVPDHALAAIARRADAFDHPWKFSF